MAKRGVTQLGNIVSVRLEKVLSDLIQMKLQRKNLLICLINQCLPYLMLLGRSNVANVEAGEWYSANSLQ